MDGHVQYGGFVEQSTGAIHAYFIVQDVCSMVNILFEEKPSLEYTFLLCWPGGFPSYVMQGLDI